MAFYLFSIFFKKNTNYNFFEFIPGKWTPNFSEIHYLFENGLLTKNIEKKFFSHYFFILIMQLTSITGNKKFKFFVKFLLYLNL